MEIKKAVEILKRMQEPEAWEPQIPEKTFEALDMAIIALERSDDKSRFFTLEYDFQYCIKVDRDTGVMYAVSNGNNNAGTFTPLINADGKPLIYKEIIKESDLVKMGVIEAGEPEDGIWMLINNLWQCNKCGCRINLKNPLDGNIWNYYFCPYCGTKMNIAVKRFQSDTKMER